MPTSGDGDRAFGEALRLRGLATAEEVDRYLAQLDEIRRLGTSPVPSLLELMTERGALDPAPSPVGRNSLTLASSPVPAPDPLGTDTGRYVFQTFLGRGGMGEVYKAWDKQLRRAVAVKFVHGQGLQDERRLVREAQLAARLKHPNIAPVYEIGAWQGRSFIAMQFVEGVTIDRARLDLRGKLRAMRDAASAVDYAHREGVIHRDLKPENLVVEKMAEGARVVVLDFGLAKPIRGGERISVSKDVVGTPAYMSPEQARGGKLDERADVYSLGATLYEILTGKPPFEANNILEVLRKIGNDEPVRPRKLKSHIHRDLETIVLKCLEKDRNRRYASAQELADDIERFLNHDPIRARPASTIYRLRLRLVKRKAAVVAAAAILCLLATAAIVVPKWRTETTAREMLETRRAQFERARPHLEAGKSVLQRIRQKGREEYKQDDLRSMAREARAHFERALKLAPNDPEIHFGIGKSFCFPNERDHALEAFGRAIKADAAFAPAYLGKVRLLIHDYERMRHGGCGKGTGAIWPETAEARALRERLEADLRQVERHSRDYPQQKYTQAIMAFANGNHAKAVAELELYLQCESEDASAHYWRGHALYHLGRNSEAIESLTRALTYDTQLLYALNLRGNLKTISGHYDEAISDLTKAIDLNPQGAAYFNNRGIAKARKGLWIEAIADYDAAIRLDATYAEAYSNRAVANDARGLFDEAIEDCDKAINLDPKFANAYFNRGNEKWAKKLVAEAIADYTKVIELEPENQNAYCNRGAAFLAKGLLHEAIADSTKAIDLDSKNANAYSNRGYARHLKGLHEEAIVDQTKAIALDVKLAAAYSNRGMARASIGLLDEAIGDYDVAIKLNPKFSEAYNNRGGARILKGLYGEAIADLTKVLDLDPANPIAYLNRGIAKDYKGLLNESIADYTKAIELDPQLGAAYNNRGSARRRKGLHDEAIADFTKAIELDPKCASAYSERGHAKYDKDLFDEAITDCTEAIRLDPKRLEAYGNRGLAKVAKGLHDDAIADFEKALTLAPSESPQRLKLLEDLKTAKADRLFQEAYRLHNSKKYLEAIEEFKVVLESFPKTEAGVNSAYNIACGYALLGGRANALEWLEKAVEMGWKDAAHLEKDSDLESLRGEDRFKKLVKALKEH